MVGALPYILRDWNALFMAATLHAGVGSQAPRRVYRDFSRKRTCAKFVLGRKLEVGPFEVEIHQRHCTVRSTVLHSLSALRWGS